MLWLASSSAMKVLLVVSDGSEEMETIVTVDILRRASVMDECVKRVIL